MPTMPNRTTSRMKLNKDGDGGNIHLLSDSWKLWYRRFNGSLSPLDWIENLHGLCEFDSVEKFWCIFNHIRTPSMLKIGCDYSVFKSDIKPMWEDTTNMNGGRWLIKDNGLLDQYWMDTLMSMIGGMYEPYNDKVCGIVYNKRQYSKLSIWISSCDSNVVNDIGLKLKQFLNTKEKIKFEKHCEILAKKKSSLYKNSNLNLMT